MDVRGLQANEMVLANPRFAIAVASLAATITGQSPSDILGEDVRQHRRTKRLTVAVVLVLASLLIALIISLLELVRLRGHP